MMEVKKMLEIKSSSMPIKIIGENNEEGLINAAGYLVMYSNENEPDLDGDFFTPDTEFDLIETPAKRGVYYNHGLDTQIKSRRIGVGEIVQDDVGLWITAQLSIRDEYENAILELIEQGKLGWSSGAAAYLVERVPFGKSQFIKKWVIAEASLTPTPAEPRASAQTKTIFSGETLEKHTQQIIELLSDYIVRVDERKKSREKEGRHLSESQKTALYEIMQSVKLILNDYEPPDMVNSKLRDELLKLEAKYLFNKTTGGINGKH